MFALCACAHRRGLFPQTMIIGPLALLAAVLGAGCMVGPNYHTPTPRLPRAWVGTGIVSTTNPASQPSVATTRPAQIETWWTSFNDPELTSLIDRAAAANLNLRQATARIRQARAVRAGTLAGFLPQVDTSGSYRRTRNGGTVIAGNTLVNGAVGGTRSAPARDLFQAGFDASWEIDVFGGVRRGIEATTAELEATIDDRRTLLVSLLSEVAIDYLQLRGFQQEIVIARQNLTSQQHTLQLTRQLAASGLRAGLDVANAEALLATTASQIPVLESDVQQAIYAISVLLGLDPAALMPELEAVQPIPTTPPTVPVGLPSELLRRRPDIRRAERQLAAATARIGVAVADLYPRFALTGSLSLQGTEFSSLGQWRNRSWSIGPSFSWPILDFGRIRANIEVQNALQEQALYGYEQTILSALQDVETSLVAYAKEQQHRQSLSEAVIANRRAVDLATQLYTQGLTDFLNVLEAQRSLYTSEDALVRSQQAVSAQLVSIYKALGGGWESELLFPGPLPPAQPRANMVRPVSD